MTVKKLIMFMGCESCTLYKLGRVFCNLGFNYGEPSYDLLENPARSRFPDPQHLWYWNAIRRFFTDMRLPPIAEVPKELLGEIQRKYYITLFARTLFQSLSKGSFICADHLSSLILPLLLESLAMLQESGIASRLYFFYDNPARSIGELILKKGQPERLGEFIWRNLAVAAMRVTPCEINFVNLEKLDKTALHSLLEEISNFYGFEGDLPQLEPINLPPLPVFPLSLSQNTLILYDALENGTLEDRKKIADIAWQAQIEQSGWQYVDCIEYRNGVSENLTLSKGHIEGCAKQDAEACTSQSLQHSNSMEPEDCPGDFMPYPDCSNENAWRFLLDKAERESLNVRNEYVARLFRQADSLGRNYWELFENLKSLAEKKRNENDWGHK